MSTQKTLSQQDFNRLYMTSAALNLDKLTFNESTVKTRDGGTKKVYRTAPVKAIVTYVSRVLDSKLGENMKERLIGIQGVNASRLDATAKELMASCTASGDFQPLANHISLVARCTSNRTAWKDLAFVQGGSEITVTFEKITNEKGTIIVCEVAQVPPAPSITETATGTVGSFFGMVDDTVPAQDNKEVLPARAELVKQAKALGIKTKGISDADVYAAILEAEEVE